MEIRFIAVRTDENEWTSGLFATAREAYEYIKTRAANEGHPITDYTIKTVEVEL